MLFDKYLNLEEKIVILRVSRVCLICFMTSYLQAEIVVAFFLVSTVVDKRIFRSSFDWWIYWLMYNNFLRFLIMS